MELVLADDEALEKEEKRAVHEKLRRLNAIYRWDKVPLPCFKSTPSPKTYDSKRCSRTPRPTTSRRRKSAASDGNEENALTALTGKEAAGRVPSSITRRSSRRKQRLRDGGVGFDAWPVNINITDPCTDDFGRDLVKDDCGRLHVTPVTLAAMEQVATTDRSPCSPDGCRSVLPSGESDLPRVNDRFGSHGTGSSAADEDKLELLHDHIGGYKCCNGFNGGGEQDRDRQDPPAHIFNTGNLDGEQRSPEGGGRCECAGLPAKIQAQVKGSGCSNDNSENEEPVTPARATPLASGKGRNLIEFPILTRVLPRRVLFESDGESDFGEGQMGHKTSGNVVRPRETSSSTELSPATQDGKVGRIMPGRRQEGVLDSDTSANCKAESRSLDKSLAPPRRKCAENGCVSDEDSARLERARELLRQQMALCGMDTPADETNEENNTVRLGNMSLCVLVHDSHERCEPSMIGTGGLYSGSETGQFSAEHGTVGFAVAGRVSSAAKRATVSNAKQGLERRASIASKGISEYGEEEADVDASWDVQCPRERSSCDELLGATLEEEADDFGIGQPRSASDADADANPDVMELRASFDRSLTPPSGVECDDVGDPDEKSKRIERAKELLRQQMALCRTSTSLAEANEGDSYDYFKEISVGLSGNDARDGQNYRTSQRHSCCSSGGDPNRGEPIGADLFQKNAARIHSDSIPIDTPAPVWDDVCEGRSGAEEEGASVGHDEPQSASVFAVERSFGRAEQVPLSVTNDEASQAEDSTSGDYQECSSTGAARSRGLVLKRWRPQQQQRQQDPWRRRRQVVSDSDDDHESAENGRLKLLSRSAFSTAIAPTHSRWRKNRQDRRTQQHNLQQRRRPLRRQVLSDSEDEIEEPVDDSLNDPAKRDKNISGRYRRFDTEAMAPDATGGENRTPPSSERGKPADGAAPSSNPVLSRSSGLWSTSSGGKVMCSDDGNVEETAWMAPCRQSDDSSVHEVHKDDKHNKGDEIEKGTGGEEKGEDECTRIGGSFNNRVDGDGDSDDLVDTDIDPADSIKQIQGKHDGDRRVVDDRSFMPAAGIPVGRKNRNSRLAVSRARGSSSEGDEQSHLLHLLRRPPPLKAVIPTWDEMKWKKRRSAEQARRPKTFLGGRGGNVGEISAEKKQCRDGRGVAVSCCSSDGEEDSCTLTGNSSDGDGGQESADKQDSADSDDSEWSLEARRKTTPARNTKEVTETGSSKIGDRTTGRRKARPALETPRRRYVNSEREGLSPLSKAAIATTGATPVGRRPEKTPRRAGVGRGLGSARRPSFSSPKGLRGAAFFKARDR